MQNITPDDKKYFDAIIQIVQAAEVIGQYNQIFKMCILNLIDLITIRNETEMCLIKHAPNQNKLSEKTLEEIDHIIESVQNDLKGNL